ncbi:MAG: ABC transporter substrate-binding protein [Clostridia bacterium]|nr:ABC transporter substrate-binding protein [Clostridia bacterium]
MKKTLRILCLVIAVILCMATAAAEDLTLTIAHIGPQTGGAAVYGLATYRGAQIAADEITAADNGIKIVLLNEDDTHDAEKAVNAYNSVMEKGAQMIVGTTTTAPCIAVGAKAYEERVFMLTPSASSTDVTADKDNVYQLCFTDPNQGSASAAVIKERNLGTKIAVIYNNADAYSTGIYQTFVNKAAELGLEIVSTTTFTDETTDYSVQVADAQNKGADLVFLPIYYTPASQILIAANSIGYTPTFFGVDGMDGILAIEGFDTSLAEGVMLLTPFVADAKDELTVNFVAKYQELYNEVPNQFAADAYDCVYALVEAAQKAGVQSGDAAEDICDGMIQAMQELEITGLTGTMSWSANGEVDKVPTAMVIKDGAYVGLDN